MQFFKYTEKLLPEFVTVAVEIVVDVLDIGGADERLL